MKNRYLILFFLISSISSIFAQSGKAKSLALGNKWVYFIQGIFVNNPYSKETVIGDTIFNNKKYAAILVDTINYKYQRADSVRIFQFNPADSSETVISDFSLDVGDSLNSAAIKSKDSINLWGRTLTNECLAFNIPSLYFYNECYTELLGLTYGSYGGEAINDYDKSLKAAFIEGKVYGDTILLAIKEPQKILPDNFYLSQNYPNPFNPTTAISYQLSAQRKIKLTVFDILGKKIKILVDKEQQAGNYTTNFNGSKLASGVYFYQLRAGNFISTKKMLLLK